MSTRVCRLFFAVLTATGLLSAQQLSYYHPGWNMFSPQQDVQAGQQAEAQALKQLPILHDSQADAYITSLGQKLAANMPGDAPKFPFRFHIVNQKEINAFALPGGAIFVNRGAICSAANEAQLAGVMAHEESHVALRHSTSMASKQQAASLPIGLLGGLLGSTGGITAAVARLSTQFAVGSYFLHYSRGMESQADALGAQVMNNSGYDPHQMADFFQTLESQGGSRTIQFLSDHPNPGNRVKAVDNEIPHLAAQTSYQNDSPEFHQIQGRLCSGQGFSSEVRAPGKAFASGSPAPETRTMQFQGLQFRYPASWQAYGSDTSAVTLAPRDGLTTQAGQTAVIRGAIVSVFEPSHRSSPQQATAELIEQLQHSNPQLREPSGRHQTLEAAGVEGDAVELININSLKQREVDRLVTFPRSDGSLLYFIFISPETEFGRLGPAFDGMVQSLRIAQQ